MDRESHKPSNRGADRREESPQTGDSAVHSIVRAFRLLEYLVHGQNGSFYSVKELSAALELAPSTIHRLLKTLCELGYVHQDAATGRYEASVKIASMGRVVLQRFRLADRILPLMRDIGGQTGESVSLVVLQGDMGIVLERVEGTNSVQLSPSYRSVQLYCTAAGKAILACRPDIELEEYLSRTSFLRVTPNTISTAVRLRAEIHDVRNRGYATDLEEYSIGARCVAMSLPVGSGIHAALSVSSLAKRFPERRMREVAALLDSLVIKHGFRLTGHSDN